MPATSLTDRYVWAVLRSVPSTQRSDLEPEIRALVADAVDAHGSDERAALAELGDPSALASRYTERAQSLIGPALFPEWRRLLTILIPVAVPIATIVVLASKLLADATLGDAIVSAGLTGFGVALHIVFWVTLVFALIERTTGTTGMPTHDWTVDDLPEPPDTGHIGVVEFVFTIVFQILVIGALLWVQLQPPIVIDGQAYPLFDPMLWTYVLPWFIVVSLGEIVFTIVRFLRGRWTYTYATINALLGAALVIPALYLWQNDLLLNPALVAEITATTGAQWLEVSGLITAVVIVVIVVIDAVDGFIKARRASLATEHPAAPGSLTA